MVPSVQAEYEAIPIQEGISGLYRHNKSLYNLFVAVLQEAVQTLEFARDTSSVRPRKRFYAGSNTVRWVLSDNTSDVFSFQNVCFATGLSVEGVREELQRRGLLEWNELKPDLVVLTRNLRVRHFRQSRVA